MLHQNKKNLLYPEWMRLNLYTQEVMPAAVAETICNAYELGKKKA